MWRKRRNKNKLKCIYLYLSFPGDSADKESACYTGDLGSIPGLGKSPREGKGYPLWYSGLENSMDCIVHGSQRVGHDWATFTHSLTTANKNENTAYQNLWDTVKKQC